MSYQTRTTRTVKTFKYSSDGGPPVLRTETITTTRDPDGSEHVNTVVNEEEATGGAQSSGGSIGVSFDGASGQPRMVGGSSNYRPMPSSDFGGQSQRYIIRGSGDDVPPPNVPPPAPVTDRNIRVKQGKPVVSKKGAKSGWGQRGSAVKPSIATQGSAYEQIKADCQSQGALWEDSEFPAVSESVFYSRRANFEWKRPHEITEDPKMFVGGASRFDIRQGELGDCWLLAAVASLTCNEKLLHQVVPTDQGFAESDGYCGMARFRFWQYGEWTDVLVDDRLPTRNGRLVFLHSESANEFWSALLEKAYAKLAGSYEALKGGSQAEAMEDFTGGLTERFDLPKAPKNLFTIMMKADKLGSLMGCAVDGGAGQIETEMDNGLVMGHAYSITAVRQVDISIRGKAGKMRLIRIRNPWGNEKEWTGAWSDKSREWSLLSEDEKAEHGISFSDDGEFWMSFDDFIKHFTTLEICSLGPDSMAGGQDDGNAWSATSELGQWKKRVCAGGCRNFLETFWTNPQFRVTVTDPDDDDEDDLCTIVVGLMQKNRRKLKKEGLDLLTMGYAIYKLKDEDLESGQADVDFFKYNASFARSPSFINTREVCGRHQLPPGTYIIVPSTFNPNEEADFLVRIFSEKPNVAGSVDEETKFSQKPEGSRVNGADRVAAPAVEDGAQDKFREMFAKISGEDMEMDAYELQGVLNKIYQEGCGFKFDGFSIETCRSMVAMKDLDHSGKLGFEEFCQLYADLKLWKSVFKKYDADQSGTFNSYELRMALKKTGFSISNATFNALVMRFANRQGLIEFDDFILCAVRLKAMFDAYGTHASRDGSSASFTLDEFVQNGLYA